jgi:hypothetical protein
MRRLALLLLAAVALLIVQHAPASAITVLDPLDTSSDTSVGKTFKSPTFFNKTYQFTVAENGTLTVDLQLFGHIDATVVLTDNNVNNAPFIPGQLSSVSGATGAFTYAGLVTGTTYFLTLLGFACSCGGYLATLSLAATPIPAALVMLLTALGGLSVLGWKRNGSAANALSAQAA